MTSLRRKFKLQKVKTTEVGRKMEQVMHKKLFFQATFWKIYLEKVNKLSKIRPEKKNFDICFCIILSLTSFSSLIGNSCTTTFKQIETESYLETLKQFC